MHFYTLLKEHSGRKVGETIELDDATATPLLEAGVIKLAENAADTLITKATEQLAEKIGTMVASIVPEAVSKAVSGIKFNGNISAGEQEADRTKSFSDFVVNIAKVSDPIHGRDAQDRLTKAYGSRYNSWENTPDPNNPTKTLATTSGASGGYTVPTGFYRQLMSVAGEEAIIRPRAFVIPMQTLEIDVPVLRQTTVPTGGSAYHGGVVLTWNVEGADADETEPVFRQTRLKAHHLTAYTEITRTLMRTSPLSLDATLMRLFGEALAHEEDRVFLVGDGIKQPLGINGCPAQVSTAARASATAISEAEVDKMWVRLAPMCRKNSIWLGAVGATEDALLTMLRSSNVVQVLNNTDAHRSIQQATAYLIKGRPLFITEKIPDLNANGDFQVIDPSMYLVGDLDMMEIATSEHFKFRSDKIAYRIVHRVAGAPWLPGAIPAQNNSSFTTSPFVRLLKNG